MEEGSVYQELCWAVISATLSYREWLDDELNGLQAAARIRHCIEELAECARGDVTDTELAQLVEVASRLEKVAEDIANDKVPDIYRDGRFDGG